MRRAWLIGIVLVQSVWELSCSAQGIRAVSRPVLMSPGPGVYLQGPFPPFVGNPTTASTPSPTPPVVPQLPPPGPPVATKEEVARNTLAFQRKRAEAGAAHAQYDLGVRHLKGDGVDKDLKLAKKWLVAAAKQGNTQASKKLEELEIARTLN